MSPITPFIRCNMNASELANWYLSVFPGSTLVNQNPVVTTINIFGQDVGFINGGPEFKPNPSISFSLWVKGEALTKQLWDKLSEGGSELMPFQEYTRSPAYGRCNDRYGVSRQVMYDNRETTKEHAMIPSLMYTQAMAGKAEEAMNLYTKLFPESKIDFLWRYEAGGVDKEGTINHGEFKLHGQQFIAMDSAMDHKFTFDEGVSLMIDCDGQEEVDHYRNALTADGGQESQCGRCKDKYGVSRQVAPKQLSQALFQSDKTKADYAMQAMMKMKKIVIKDLAV